MKYVIKIGHSYILSSILSHFLSHSNRHSLNKLSYPKSTSQISQSHKYTLFRSTLINTPMTFTREISIKYQITMITSLTVYICIFSKILFATTVAMIPVFWGGVFAALGDTTDVEFGSHHYFYLEFFYMMQLWVWYLKEVL